MEVMTETIIYYLKVYKYKVQLYKHFPERHYV
jgi:hypothetical protein